MKLADKFIKIHLVVSLIGLFETVSYALGIVPFELAFGTHIIVCISFILFNVALLIDKHNAKKQ